jgi:hypothetical protein
MPSQCGTKNPNHVFMIHRGFTNSSTFCNGQAIHRKSIRGEKKAHSSNITSEGLNHPRGLNKASLIRRERNYMFSVLAIQHSYWKHCLVVSQCLQHANNRLYNIRVAQLQDLSEIRKTCCMKIIRLFRNNLLNMEQKIVTRLKVSNESNKILILKSNFFSQKYNIFFLF